MSCVELAKAQGHPKKKQAKHMIKLFEYILENPVIIIHNVNFRNTLHKKLDEMEVHEIPELTLVIKHVRHLIQKIVSHPEYVA